MLVAKNTLCRLSLLRFTGWSAGSPGQRPFCSSASISVPGAPAASLATRSQERASNDGMEIRAPDCVAVALLATRQPPAPRSVRSLAPVAAAAPVPPGAGAALDAEIRTAGETVLPGVACAPGASNTREVATQAIEADRAKGGRRARFTAGNS